MCGKTFTDTDWGQFQQHQSNCPLKTECLNYRQTLRNGKEEIAFDMLVAWFNSFPNFQKYLKNDEDITKIDRTGFFRPQHQMTSEWLNLLTEFRKRERERERESKI